MTIFDDIRKALEAGEPHCLKCGLPRSNHICRHPFQPSHTTTLEALAPDMARIALAAEELAIALMMVEGQRVYSASDGFAKLHETDASRHATRALAAFRAACGDDQ